MSRIGFLSTRVLIDNAERRRPCVDTIIIRPPLGCRKEISIPKSAVNFVEYPINAGQKWFAVKAENGRIFTFPLKTTLPKVQLARYVPKKELPRDVEEDRRRRAYSKLDLENEIKNAAIDATDFHPTEMQFYDLERKETKHFFPLSFFDNFDYDEHSPEEWLALGDIGTKIYPLPGKAYLPTNLGSIDYSWQYVAVDRFNSQELLWHVVALKNEIAYNIPRCQLMFLAEDPRVYVQRLAEAIRNRNVGESMAAVVTMVDCAVHLNVEEDKMHEPIKCTKKILSKYLNDKVFYDIISTEIELIYEYIMTALDFEKFLSTGPKDFGEYDMRVISLSLPKAHISRDSRREYLSIKELKINMAFLKYSILRTMLTYIPATIEVTQGVVTECEYLETLSVFITQFARPIALQDFINSQQKNSNTVGVYLRDVWPHRIAAILVMIFRANGKGSMDVTLRRWRIYEMCKISLYILQTKLRMEDAIHYLLERSIIKFTNLLKNPCLQFMDISSNYVWPAEDFINTPFPYPKPVFYLIISVSNDRKVVYSTPPEDFQPSILKVFKQAIEKSNGIHCIDAETMKNLRFSPNLYILTIELIEELYIKCNDELGECYKKAIIPLRAYAKLFERFIDFYLIDVPSYMKKYQESNKASVTVKADILEHKRQKEEIRRILPAFITIGPFYINVDQMKQYMVNKHIEIVRKIFEYFIHRMFLINEELQERCRSTFMKIAERPQSIEHLLEIHDFSETVPDIVEGIKADIQIMWLEYDMLDSFFYCLSDAQFFLKWDVYAWPHRIMQRLSTLREEQKVDIEEFKRVHNSECILLEEHLESLNDEIQVFSLQFDPNKAVESTVEVKKIWKTITELIKMGETLKFRQNLFELEPLSLEFLESIITSFTPYRDLWFAATDFLKLEEATNGNPLNQVDLEEVWNTLEEIRSSLKKSYKIFNEIPEMQEVANFYLNRIDGFKPVYDCITALKNEHWLLLHWQELAQLTGVDIKYNTNLNFQYCIRKGILDHLDVVREISDRAEVDAEELRRSEEEQERLREQERLAIEMRRALRKCRRDIE